MILQICRPEGILNELHRSKNFGRVLNYQSIGDSETIYLYAGISCEQISSAKEQRVWKTQPAVRMAGLGISPSRDILRYLIFKISARQALILYVPRSRDKSIV